MVSNVSEIESEAASWTGKLSLSEGTTQKSSRYEVGDDGYEDDINGPEVGTNGSENGINCSEIGVDGAEVGTRASWSSTLSDGVVNEGTNWSISSLCMHVIM